MGHATFPVGGGLDLTTPDAKLPAGMARRMQNFEVAVEGGHRRISGYERFSGQPYPSQAVATVIRLVAPATSGNLDDVVVGVTSGATGILASAIPVLNTSLEVIMADSVGAFVIGETINIGGVPVGVVAGFGTLDNSAYWQSKLRNFAYGVRRRAIDPVPGIGPVSVGAYKGKVYAWRSSSGGNLRMYQQSPTGWDQIGLGYEVYFKTGTVEIFDGDNVVGLTSGGKMIVGRVVLQSGSWGAGTAAGKLVCKLNSSAPIQVGETLVANGVNAAVATSTTLNIKLDAGGRVRTIVDNVVGGTSGLRMYGIDGVNRGFEYDGTIYVPIDTGMKPDRPTVCTVFKKHLFFGFGASLQNSGIAAPYSWTPITGAGEISVSGNITDLVPQSGSAQTGALYIITDNQPHVLYGNSTADFNLDASNTGSHGVANTAVNLEKTYVLCDHGVASVESTQNFGNFVGSTLTANVVPLVAAHRGRATCATVNRDKSQYRVFYNDGFGFYLTILNGNFLGLGTVQFPDPVWSVCECEDGTGGKSNFFGTLDGGYVYRLDAGSTFDGSAISYLLVLPSTDCGDPRMRKRFKRAALDIGDVSYVKFKLGYDLDYGDRSRVSASEFQDVTRNSSLELWDSFVWDMFTWDGYDLTQSVVDTPGRGVAIALRIQGTQEIVEPFVINNVTIHYAETREARS